MGCKSTKAPAAPVALEAPEADFNPIERLVKPDGHAELKKATTSELGNVDNLDSAAQTSPPAEPPLAENSVEFYSRENSAAPATGEETSTDLPTFGVQTANLTDAAPSGHNSPRPGDKKPESKDEDAQQVERAHPEASAPEPEIPTGLQCMAEPCTPEETSASKHELRRSVEEGAALKAATKDKVIKKVDEKAKGPNASMADSISTRKEKGMCCC